MTPLPQSTATLPGSPSVNAPHTSAALCADEWTHPYSRQRAAFPSDWTRNYKFWPAVARINDVYGDRNLVCSCPPLEELAS